MTLSSETLAQIARDSAKLADRNHVGFLAEAMGALQPRGADKYAALRLLAAFWGTAYASRPQQKVALNDVGEWLEKSTRAAQSIDELQLRIGWMKRVAGQGARGARDQRPREHGIKRKFGHRIPMVRAQRGDTERNDRDADAVKAVSVRKVVKITTLPDRFVAQFQDFTAARAAFQTHKKRMKKKKPPKDRMLALIPMDNALKSLTAGLVCVTTSTIGFIEYFQAVEAAGGGALPFFVVGTEEKRALEIRVKLND